MFRHFHFFVCSLPSLPDLGGAPPVDLARFRGWAAEEPALVPLIDAVFLEQDLLWREAALAGQADRPAPLVLTEEQVAGRESLPAGLQPPAETSRRFPSDATWEAYWRFAAAEGARRGSPFLRDWAVFEVGLRNALARERARLLALDPREFLVAEDLAARFPAEGEDEPPADVARAWAEAPDPLSALRVLDEARLRWTRRHSAYFTFRNDEVSAYARHLVLVHRWKAMGRG
jgi:hypothetical protein